MILFVYDICRKTLVFYWGFHFYLDWWCWPTFHANTIDKHLVALVWWCTFFNFRYHIPLGKKVTVTRRKDLIVWGGIFFIKKTKILCYIPNDWRWHFPSPLAIFWALLSGIFPSIDIMEAALLGVKLYCDHELHLWLYFWNMLICISFCSYSSFHFSSRYFFKLNFATFHVCMYYTTIYFEIIFIFYLHNYCLFFFYWVVFLQFCSPVCSLYHLLLNFTI